MGSIVASPFAPLREWSFRWFFLSSLTSYSNVWALRIAQTWLVLELSGGDALMLGFTTAAQFVPILLVGLIGGSLADRFNKLRILAACDLVIGTLAVANAVLVATGVVRAWHVVALALLMGTAAAIGQPARQVLPGELVRSHHLIGAMSLTQSTWAVGRIIGPVQAALLLSAWGMAACLVLAGVLLIVFALLIVRLLAGRLERRHRSGGTGVLAGVGYVLRRPDLSIVLAVMLVVCALGWNSQLTIALMADELFGTAGAFSTLTAVFAFGGVLGTLGASRLARPRPVTFAISLLVFCLVTLAAGLVPSGWWFGVLMVPVGFTSLVVAVSASVLFVTVSPIELRGRVTAFFQVASSGATAVGGPVLGLLAVHGGARATYTWSALVMAAAVIAAGCLVMGSSRLRDRSWWQPPSSDGDEG